MILNSHESYLTTLAKKVPLKKRPAGRLIFFKKRIERSGQRSPLNLAASTLVGDILAVRSDLTMAKTASGRTDVDMSGTVLVQDILDTRSNLAKELTQISVPALP